MATNISVREAEGPFVPMFDSFRILDPFAEMTKTRQTINSLLDAALRPVNLSGEPVFDVRVDLYEKDGAYVVKCELPGMKKEDVEIKVIENRLTIAGKTRWENKEEQARYVYRELRQGAFTRTFILDDPIDPKAIDAALEYGILTVKFPAAKATPPQTVPIKT
jgi:HSP20 family protein